MKLKGIEIEPGMVLETTKGAYVAFPTKTTNRPIAFCMIREGGWTFRVDEESIIRITGLTAGGNLYSGKVLWDSKSQPIEVSMEEIAKKFGISVEQLRIKKE